MGLTGTTSWSASTKSNGTTIQRYQISSKSTVSTVFYQGTSYFTYSDASVNYYDEIVEWEPAGYCRFRITTDAAGCTSLSFHCTGATRQQSGNKLYCRLSTSSTFSTSGGKAATYSSGWKYTFSDAKLLPNTNYYIHIWGHGVTSSGIMTITAAGTYGAPGDIVCDDSIDFEEPLEMSYGSITEGAKYTVKVKVGKAAQVTLQTYSASDGANSSLVWTPLLSDYGNLHYDTMIVSTKITVETYFGTTLAGTKEKIINVNFTEEQVTPEIDNTVFSIEPINEGVVSSLLGYIKGYSAIRASFDDSGVTLKYGAQIINWTVKFGSESVIVIDDDTIISQDSNIISETTPVIFTLTDSRGFTLSQTLTATIIPYQEPTIVTSVFRCNSTGVEDDAGTYCKIQLTATYADVNSQNTILPLVYVKLKSDESYGTPIQITGGTTTQSGTNDIYSVSSFLLSGFLDRVYDIKIQVTDELGNIAILNSTIQSQAWAIHIRSGGRGVALGKASERDYELDIGTWKLTCGAISSHIIVEFDSLASLPITIYDTDITANHIVVRDELTEPSAMIGSWSVDTYNGSLTVDGAIRGTTDLRLVLEIPGTSISA